MKNKIMDYVKPYYMKNNTIFDFDLFLFLDDYNYINVKQFFVVENKLYIFKNNIIDIIDLNNVEIDKYKLIVHYNGY